MCPLHSLKSSDIYDSWNVENIYAQALSDMQSRLK